MAQFDNLIIFPLVWSSLIIIFFYYFISIKVVIPNFFGARKFRDKQWNLSSESNLANISNRFI